MRRVKQGLKLLANWQYCRRRHWQSDINKEAEEGDGLKDKLVYLNRVAKVVKGGKRFNFSALVVVGDGNGKIGVGKGKAAEAPVAIKKAVERAKKNMVLVSLEGRHDTP